MRTTFKIYMLAFMSFLVATTEFIVAGILDKIAAVSHVSISTAGQLITVFAIANAIGTPVVMMAMAKIDLRRVLMLSLLILVIGSILTGTLSGFGFLIFARVVLDVKRRFCHCRQGCRVKTGTIRAAGRSHWNHHHGVQCSSHRWSPFRTCCGRNI